MTRVEKYLIHKVGRISKKGDKSLTTIETKLDLILDHLTNGVVPEFHLQLECQIPATSFEEWEALNQR